MILVCGIPTEGPVERVISACETQGLEHVVVHQRRFASQPLDVTADRGGVGGRLVVDGRTIALEDVVGVYLRTMEPALLPEFEADPAVCEAWHDTLCAWTELTPARVANRISAMDSNSSKPYQAQLIAAAGFDVPDTLVSNDPEAVLAFRSVHRRLIYKSVSGVRSIVRELQDGDLARLEAIRWCPTQFQELVEGTDVRVHTIGTCTVFATEVVSAGTDYRYDDAELSEAALPDDVAERCVRLAASLGLELAGIDLRLADDGRVVCFEVNPSPAYSYYEANTGQPIAAAIARHLAGDSAH